MRLHHQRSVADSLSILSVDDEAELTLKDGSRVAVIGGGPAGSFFAYFVLKMAQAVDLELAVDIYEPRGFSRCGPAGCNHCGGIVSESLVQILASEGIVLPAEVVQRGIGQNAHQSDLTAPIDEPASVLPQISADRSCDLGEGGVRTRVGPAIDTQ